MYKFILLALFIPALLLGQWSPLNYNGADYSGIVYGTVQDTVNIWVPDGISKFCLYAWFDDAHDLGSLAAGTAADSVLLFGRCLPSEEYINFPAGTPFIKISWVTATTGWAVEDTIELFSDSAIYSSWIPDSLVGNGLEAAIPCAGDIYQVLIKAPTNSDTIDYHLIPGWK